MSKPTSYQGYLPKPPTHPRATPVQIDLLAELFIDCGFNTPKQRKIYLQHRFGMGVQFTDDLYLYQAASAISELIQQRKELRGH